MLDSTLNHTRFIHIIKAPEEDIDLMKKEFVAVIEKKYLTILVECIGCIVKKNIYPFKILKST